MKLKPWHYAAIAAVVVFFLFRDKVVALMKAVGIVNKNAGAIDKGAQVTNAAGDTALAGLGALKNYLSGLGGPSGADSNPVVADNADDGPRL